MKDPHNLHRFVEAQMAVYHKALAEIRRGWKDTHWMWFIFPRLNGVGYSAASQYFALEGIREAEAYLAHPVLGKRLKQCATALLKLQGRTALSIFGPTDRKKLLACATVFAIITPPGSVFDRLLTKYFPNEREHL